MTRHDRYKIHSLGRYDRIRPTSTTYGELAARAGLERAARAAGQACAQNLIAPVVPCHRVLPAAGGKGLKRFGGYYYGPERKEWLLHHEATTR
ncbi:O-6-methylguanine DNA methyltransferase [Thermomonospora echinospora]|uniref:O-6-methylguanine DNA methyltransferase n=1 Tax=Thermomonospora echinospora TaxID=1992 RepID=A0A1H6E0S1_9ACTN|nr:methylated-DNA--[protein]-cysteine S-methyltransferase [Thermomonospora echinospora]SEG90753.1 O-6-methylguanine DNA methyltransferase [Thermomonospora echinospora]